MAMSQDDLWRRAWEAAQQGEPPPDDPYGGYSPMSSPDPAPVPPPPVVTPPMPDEPIQPPAPVSPQYEPQQPPPWVPPSPLPYTPAAAPRYVPPAPVAPLPAASPPAPAAPVPPIEDLTPPVSPDSPKPPTSGLEDLTPPQDGGFDPMSSPDVSMPTRAAMLSPGTATPIHNDDGSITTERTITVTEPDLNDGRPTNIPTVWNGRVVSDDEAVSNAIDSGRPFASFRTIREAERSARQRSHDLGTGQATSVGGARVDDPLGLGAPAPAATSAVDRATQVLQDAGALLPDTQQAATSLDADQRASGGQTLPLDTSSQTDTRPPADQPSPGDFGPGVDFGQAPNAGVVAAQDADRLRQAGVWRLSPAEAQRMGAGFGLSPEQAQRVHQEEVTKAWRQGRVVDENAAAAYGLPTIMGRGRPELQTTGPDAMSSPDIPPLPRAASPDEQPVQGPPAPFPDVPGGLAVGVGERAAPTTVNPIDPLGLGQRLTARLTAPPTAPPTSHPGASALPEPDQTPQYLEGQDRTVSTPVGDLTWRVPRIEPGSAISRQGGIYDPQQTVRNPIEWSQEASLGAVRTVLPREVGERTIPLGPLGTMTVDEAVAQFLDPAWYPGIGPADILMARAAEPVMHLIGGAAGRVLRSRVAATLAGAGAGAGIAAAEGGTAGDVLAGGMAGAGLGLMGGGRGLEAARGVLGRAGEAVSDAWHTGREVAQRAEALPGEATFGTLGAVPPERPPRPSEMTPDQWRTEVERLRPQVEAIPIGPDGVPPESRDLWRQWSALNDNPPAGVVAEKAGTAAETRVAPALRPAVEAAGLPEQDLQFTRGLDVRPQADRQAEAQYLARAGFGTGDAGHAVARGNGTLEFSDTILGRPMESSAQVRGQADTVAHEVGHTIYQNLPDALKTEWEAQIHPGGRDAFAFGEHLQAGGERPPTGYAGESPGEDFADSWRVFRRGGVDADTGQSATLGPKRQVFLEQVDRWLRGNEAAATDTGGVGALGSVGAVPGRLRDVLEPVNRYLGASLVGGTTGAAVGAGTDQEDPLGGARRGALVGAGLGVAGTAGLELAARRGNRALPRVAAPAADRLLPEVVDGSGLHASLGAVPPRRPAAESPLSSPDPIIQRMARQMGGQHAPSTVPDPRSTMQRASDAWSRAMTDDRTDIYNLQQRVSKAIGRPLTADEMAAELTRANPASTASQRLEEGLRPALLKVGADDDWLAQYLVHTHNVDVAREVGQQTYEAAIAAGASPVEASNRAMHAANSRHFSGDLTITETQRQLQKIEDAVRALPNGDTRWQNIQDAAGSVWDFNRETLARKRDAGIVPPDLYDSLTQKYPHYVRTDIADYFEKPGGGPSPGKRVAGLSDIGIQKISPEGTTKERVNPLLSTIDQTYRSEAAIQRNEAGRALENLIDQDPSLQSVFKEVVLAQGVNRGDPLTTVPSSYSLRNGEQFLTTWKDGTSRTYVVPKEFGAILNPGGPAILNPESGIVAPWRMFVTTYKSLITSLNLGFGAVVSPLRDLGDYTVQEMTHSAEHQGARGAAEAVGALPGIMADYVRALPEAFHGILQGTYHGDLGAMMREGGGMGSRPGSSEADLRRAYQDLTKPNIVAVRDTRDLLALAKNVATGFAGPLGERLEQVPRLVAARREAARGGSPIEQAMRFRDATVDFQRGGTISRQLNALIPFFNVGQQAGAQLARTFRENPAAASAAVATAVGLPVLAAEAWNRSDPQRAQDYEDVPDYLKRTGIVLMLPGVVGTDQRGDRRPNLAWIPTGSYGTLVETMRDAATNAVKAAGGDAKARDPGTWAQLGADLLGATTPVRGESPGAAMTQLIPPGLKTGAALWLNRDTFRGGTIATDRRDEDASALSQGSAAAVNAVTGRETRPSQWEYLYRDLGGSLASTALGASDLLTGRTRDEHRPIQDMPVVGGTLGRVVRDSVGQQLQNAQDTRFSAPARQVIAAVGLRTDQLLTADSIAHDVPLTRAEQAQVQRLTNQYANAAIVEAPTAISNWNQASLAARQQAVRDRYDAARTRAEAQVFNAIPQDERGKRIQRAQQKKAP